jgi:hypothetical protein
MDIEVPPHVFGNVTQLWKRKGVFRATGSLSQLTIVARIFAGEFLGAGAKPFELVWRIVMRRT